MTSPLLECRELAHAYRDGRRVLDGVSFSLNAGESVALLGPNGAGKTTLFLRLGGVLPGTLGQAFASGLDCADAKNRHELPKKIGFVFQNPDEQLFAATVLDDVAFGPLNLGNSKIDAKAKAEAAIVRVGLNGCADRAPHSLSGGEKRRAALAGVLAMEPPLLLLDEPTVFLDSRGRKELSAILKTFEGTLLISTHDLDFARKHCERCILLDAGKIASDTSTSELFARPEFLEEHGLD